MKKLLLTLGLLILSITALNTAKADYLSKRCGEVEVYLCNADNGLIDRMIAKLQYQKDRQALSCDYDVMYIEQDLKQDIENLFNGYKSTTTVCENVIVKARRITMPSAFGSNIIKTKYGLY